MVTIRGIVFDLDDTLYLEREYVRSGFWYVARCLAERSSVAVESIFGCLWQDFEAGVRGKAFDTLFDTYPNLTSVVAVSELVQLYRGHRPEICFNPGTQTLLESLHKDNIRLGILSDGPLRAQQAKADALRLSALFDPVILTDRWGVDYWKPHPRGYEHIAAAWGLQGSELMYVADNPIKDFLTPRRLGWQTVRLRMDGQQHHHVEPSTTEYSPEREIHTLAQLQHVLGGARSAI